MSSDLVDEEPEPTPAVDEMRPESITCEGLPIVMRGYDRERADRLLSRVAEAYGYLVLQRDSLRARISSVEAELAAAEEEARASARSVAELVHRCASVDSELSATRSVRDDLTQRLSRVEAERAQALAELQASAGRAEELERRAHTLEQALRDRLEAPPELPGQASEPAWASRFAGSEAEAARLLLEATRASEQLRETAREQMRTALKKARERVALVEGEAEREQARVAEMKERARRAEDAAEKTVSQARAEVERMEARVAEMEEWTRRAEGEAEEILARAHAEAAGVASAVSEERDRVRLLLTGALASLDVSSQGASSGDLVADLAARLQESSAPVQESGAPVQESSSPDEADVSAAEPPETLE
jgi:chromosome segregation ATPase